MVESSTQDVVLESERLKDPLKDRQVPTNVLPMPPQQPLAFDRVYKKNDPHPNINLVKKYLMEGGKFSKELIRETITRAGAILTKEPNLIKMDGKVTIVGDVHG